MWNFELFISKRLVASKKYKSSISAPIIKIGVIAIALGVIVMLISIATGVGLQKKIREKVSGFNGHIQIVNYDNNNSQVSVKPISTHQDFYPVFNSVEGIHNVQVFSQKAGIIKTETDFEGIVVKGVGQDYNWSFFEDYLVQGNLPTYTDKRSDAIIISQSLADKLQFKVGDQATFWFVKNDPKKMPNIRKWTISGIYNSGFPDFDDTYILADIKHIQRLNKWQKDEVGGFEILVDDFDRIDIVAEQVRDNLPPTLNSYSIKRKFPLIFEWIALFDSNIIAIIFLMLLVSGFNMITVLLVLILERTQMIGLLKALGNTNWSIRKIFLYQASYLVINGLLWGNLIGLSLLFAQKHFGLISLDPETYYVSQAPVHIDFLQILLLNAGVVILTFILLMLPSYFITKISPAKAIKFE